MDPFCWFYLHFKIGKCVKQEDYWQQHLTESDVATWRGIAFEELCFLHIAQIKSALHIGGVASQDSSYVVRGDGAQDGMQVDLLIERADDVVNICEMKYYRLPFVVNKQYAQTLSHRLEVMESKCPAKTVHLTYIGSFELVRNECSDIFTSCILLDDLYGF